MSPQDAEAPFRALCAESADAPVALLHSGGATEGRTLFFRDLVDRLVVPLRDADRAIPRVANFLRRHPQTKVVVALGYAAGERGRRLPQAGSDRHFDVASAYAFAFADVQEWRGLRSPETRGWEHLAANLKQFEVPGMAPHVTRADYERRVATVIERIRAGEIFQANITQPFSSTGSATGDPREAFFSLCRTSPAPFAAYLSTGDGTAILSSSPEEFLWRRGDSVRTRPIKGTRPRGSDEATDQALLRELLASAKDQAELAMIVDLMRNDLGRVAKPAGVTTAEGFPEHDSFAHVHHLVHTVDAELRKDTGWGELLEATFPPGSITGAPKLRCMEILEELEVVPRGIYTGALGWLSAGAGGAPAAGHLNVAIRTITVQNGHVRINVGGGITADSDPAEEYLETLAKARGMLTALRVDVAMAADAVPVVEASGEDAVVETMRGTPAAPCCGLIDGVLVESRFPRSWWSTLRAAGETVTADSVLEGAEAWDSLLHRGESVFETMAVRSDGSIPLLLAHRARLERSLRAVGSEAAVPSRVAFEDAARLLLVREGLLESAAESTAESAGSGIAGRPTAASGLSELADLGHAAGLPAAILRVAVRAEAPHEVFTLRHANADADRVLRLLVVAEFGVGVGEPDVAADVPVGVKGTPRVRYERVMAAARDAGCDDALLVNVDGLLETAHGNVFVWLDGAWCTPPVAMRSDVDLDSDSRNADGSADGSNDAPCALLPGVGRRALLDACRAADVPVRETTVPLAAVQTAGRASRGSSSGAASGPESQATKASAAEEPSCPPIVVVNAVHGPRRAVLQHDGSGLAPAPEFFALRELWSTLMLQPQSTE